MTTKLLKTIDETTIDDLTCKIIDYIDGQVLNDKLIIDHVKEIIFEALGINKNHDGIEKFKCNIMDVYDTYKSDPNRALIYCSNVKSTYNFEDWKEDFDPDAPAYEETMMGLYDKDIEIIEEDDYRDFIEMISRIIEYEGRPIVMYGVGATWMGTSEGGYIFDDVDMFKNLIGNYQSTVRFIFDKGENDFYMTETSHDCPMGGTEYHFRIMTDAGAHLWETRYESYGNKDRKTIDIYFNSNDMTRNFTLEDLEW